MTLSNFANKNLFLPISDLFFHKSISKKIKFLQKSQFWSKNELIEYQNSLLRQLIEHSYYHVPFYRKIFDELNLTPIDIYTQEDLKKLPVLNKNSIRDGIKSNQLFADNLNEKDLIKNSSSGSTGEPLQFFETKLSESMKKASAIRGWEWMGFQLGDKILRISHIPRKGLTKKLQDLFTNSLYIHASEINNECFQLIVEKINTHNPKILRMTPEALNFLVKYMNANRITPNKIHAINTTGSVLTNTTRNQAETIFGCKIFDGFSCEGGAVVFECPTHQCYHSSMEYAITEVLDSNDKPVHKGRLITTDLWNYATPFIRYDTQDIVELEETNCSCGRELLPIKQIFGRSSDVLITPKGKYIIVNHFTGYFQEINEIEQFQIFQKGIDHFVIYLKVSDNYNNDKNQLVYELCKKIINENVQIEIIIVDDIPVEKSGKRRFLIRNKNIQLK